VDFRIGEDDKEKGEIEMIHKERERERESQTQIYNALARGPSTGHRRREKRKNRLISEFNILENIRATPETTKTEHFFSPANGKKESAFRRRPIPPEKSGENVHYLPFDFNEFNDQKGGLFTARSGESEVAVG
jgi:hypothetical protein